MIHQALTNSNEANEPMGAGWSKRGLRMMGSKAKARRGRWRLRGGVGAAGGAPAQAQNKELSDKSVRLLMQYAWAYDAAQVHDAARARPSRSTRPSPTRSIVPIDMAREVIRVARLSAYAQLCDCRKSSAPTTRP